MPLKALKRVRGRLCCVVNTFFLGKHNTDDQSANWAFEPVTFVTDIRDPAKNNHLLISSGRLTFGVWHTKIG